MAISATGGTSGNSAIAVSSLSLPSYTSHSGQDILIAIALGSIGSSVSSIAASAGSYGTPTLQASKNGSGIRVELWSVHVVTGAATLFTVNITGGSATIAVALEEYSGLSAEGSNSSSSGSDVHPRVSIALTQGNNWSAAALAFVTGASTTQGAVYGTSRQASIAASAVGVALYDATNQGDGTVPLANVLNSSENWASAAVEMQTGGSAVTYLDWPAGIGPSLEQSRDIRILHCLEPLFAQQQEYPPTPGANNYGFVG